ncbi:neuronal PAS domain-containing protein 2-like isoform X1 [Branchiostoma floridae]|uniref:Neuronal PAS domain-containing protein 2-like isoform X1 n=1 Tax=Branchiostoma floridae TaxID=7739 RepID=A0A9J7LFU4_BRAFL|nr:neuronal PAS domain-containing protein 2-like isoform X1 [Branchiostoma floridae]
MALPSIQTADSDAMSSQKVEREESLSGCYDEGNLHSPLKWDDESSFMYDDMEEDEKDRNKRQSRNRSEKKRRDQFNILINELCSMVSSNNRKMDKSSVLQSTIAFLKRNKEITAQSEANEIKENWKPPFLTNEEFSQLMLDATNGFMLAINKQGKILYVSENVTSLLGHLPNDLVGNTLGDMVHEKEKVQTCNLLTHHTLHLDQTESDYGHDKHLSFSCHFVRGKIDPTEEPAYECIKLSGSYRRSLSGKISSTCKVEKDNQKTKGGVGGSGGDEVVLVMTAKLLAPLFLKEMSVVDETKREFTSRHSLEWKFLFLDHRAPPIIGYLPFEVLGTSGYDYYHVDDLDRISICHEQLMQCGEGTSCCYRFLTKGQQWIWLQTRYYITYNQWNSKPEFIVCTHTVVSYSEVCNKLRQELGLSDSGDNVDMSVSFGTLKRSLSNSSLAVSEKSRKSQRSSAPDRSPHGSAEMHSVQVGETTPGSVQGEDFPDITKQYKTLNDLLTTKTRPVSSHSSSTSVQQPSNPSQRPQPSSSHHSAPQTVPSAAQSSLAKFSQYRVADEISSTGTLTENDAMTTMSESVYHSPPSEMPMGALIRPPQLRLQEQLLQRHQALQDTIRRQQEELQLLRQQILMQCPMVTDPGVLTAMSVQQNSLPYPPSSSLPTPAMPYPPSQAAPMTNSMQQVPQASLLTSQSNMANMPGGVFVQGQMSSILQAPPQGGQYGAGQVHAMGIIQGQFVASQGVQPGPSSSGLASQMDNVSRFDFGQNKTSVVTNPTSKGSLMTTAQLLSPQVHMMPPPQSPTGVPAPGPAAQTSKSSRPLTVAQRLQMQQQQRLQQANLQSQVQQQPQQQQQQQQQQAQLAAANFPYYIHQMYQRQDSDTHSQHSQ